MSGIFTPLASAIVVAASLSGCQIFLNDPSKTAEVIQDTVELGEDVVDLMEGKPSSPPNAQQPALKAVSLNYSF